MVFLYSVQGFIVTNQLFDLIISRYVDEAYSIIFRCVHLGMNRQLISLLSVFCIACTLSCSSESGGPLQINGFHLSSENPDALAIWYAKNLGFNSDISDGSLTLTNELTQIGITQGNLPADQPNGQRTPGFFKIGFKTSDLDGLYAKLTENGSDFRGDIFYDNNLKTRSLVSLDSDGNRVQFFEDQAVTGLTPYFFSLMALDFEQTKAWCESEFGFVEAYNLDLPERGISIRLMRKDGVLLELISDKRLVSATTTLPGIQSVVFNRSRSAKSEGTLVYKSAQESQNPG
ncbi:MAG: VOC family protein [Roseivirga sp.]|nr:VOC family protein [Roseivirga sp.]